MIHYYIDVVGNMKSKTCEKCIDNPCFTWPLLKKKNESIIMKKWLNNDKDDPCTIYIFLPKI